MLTCLIIILFFAIHALLTCAKHNLKPSHLKEVSSTLEGSSLRKNRNISFATFLYNSPGAAEVEGSSTTIISVQHASFQPSFTLSSHSLSVVCSRRVASSCFFYSCFLLCFLCHLPLSVSHSALMLGAPSVLQLLSYLRHTTLNGGVYAAGGLYKYWRHSV